MPPTPIHRVQDHRLSPQNWPMDPTDCYENDSVTTSSLLPKILLHQSNQRPYFLNRGIRRKTTIALNVANREIWLEHQSSASRPPTSNRSSGGFQKMITRLVSGRCALEPWKRIVISQRSHQLLSRSGCSQWNDLDAVEIVFGILRKDNDTDLRTDSPYSRTSLYSYTHKAVAMKGIIIAAVQDSAMPHFDHITSCNSLMLEHYEIVVL